MRPSGVEPASQSAAPSLTALDHVNTGAHALFQLKHELRLLEDPNVVGRDADRIRGYLTEVHRAELGIARSLNLDWPQPPDTS